MVVSDRIELPTQGFSVPCSTDWATKPKWRFRRELNPRSSAWQADVITATLRNHGCGSWIWTNDLRVMSPTSYQTAPSRDITKWRRKRDSNPRAVSDLPVFKTGPFNQTWVFLHVVPEAGLEPARDLTPAGF